MAQIEEKDPIFIQDTSSEIKYPAPAIVDPEYIDPMPSFEPVKRIAFSWGDIPGESFSKQITSVFKEIVYWKKNLFKIPSGRAGKAFISEKAKLFECMTADHPMEGICMEAAAVMEHLLLQRSHKKSKSKQNREHLLRRMGLWKKGEISALRDEALTIQKKLKKSRRKMSTNEVSRIFSKLIFQGKI